MHLKVPADESTGRWHVWGANRMRMFWRDLREAVKKLEQSGCSVPCVTMSTIVCGLVVAMAMAASPVLAQQTPAAPAHSPRKAHRTAKPQPVVPESIPEVAMPVPPPPERRVPEQMPPGVPQVSWDGSELTIIADNSTLADILVAIRTRTGAEIDVPTNASHERIAARLGPGPAREIIATLLSWTDFDYIIQASDSDPAGIQSVLLTPRGKSDAVVASAAMDRFGASARRANHRVSQEPAPESSGSPEAETSTETPIAVAQPAPTDPQSTAEVVPPAAQDGPPAQTEAPSRPLDTQAALNPALGASQESALSQSAGSSNEQRMQMLQSLYQQRKQMTQDARKNPAN